MLLLYEINKKYMYMYVFEMQLKNLKTLLEQMWKTWVKLSQSELFLSCSSPKDFFKTKAIFFITRLKVGYLFSFTRLNSHLKSNSRGKLRRVELLEHPKTMQNRLFSGNLSTRTRWVSYIYSIVFSHCPGSATFVSCDMQRISHGYQIHLVKIMISPESSSKNSLFKLLLK